MSFCKILSCFASLIQASSSFLDDFVMFEVCSYKDLFFIDKDFFVVSSSACLGWVKVVALDSICVTSSYTLVVCKFSNAFEPFLIL